MPRRTKPARRADSSGASSPTSNCKPVKPKKVLKRKAAISDDEMSERDVVEMVHEKSGGRWTAFAERAEEEDLAGHDDEELAADTGDAGAEEEGDEDEDDEEEDEDV